MLKITEILNFPDGTPVDAVQGKISAVYPARTVTNPKGSSTVQNAELSDIAGNKIKLTVWDHPDLTPLKDNEYVLHNTGDKRYPGIKVKHGSYVASKDGRNHKVGDTVKTIELNVNKHGCFQHIEVYNQSKPAGATPAAPASKPVAAEPGPDVPHPYPQAVKAQGIHGATVGMAVKAALDILAHNGEPITIDSIRGTAYEVASEIIRLSQKLEAGRLAPEGKKNEDSDVPY